MTEFERTGVDLMQKIPWFVKYFLSRHKNNVNRVLHIVGIPEAFYGLFQLITGRFGMGLLNLFLGYLWQWIGHKYFEKNEVGEVILIKKLICRRFAQSLDRK